jgi:hypothetical protein
MITVNDNDTKELFRNGDFLKLSPQLIVTVKNFGNCEFVTLSIAFTTSAHEI